MLKVYNKERMEEISKISSPYPDVYFTEEKIANLPIPIQTYLYATGYINQPMMYNADVIWKESFIKLKSNKPWQQLETKQFNSIDPLVRIAYMKFLSMPVSGRDIYRNGQGEMKGKLFNLFTVIHGKGKEVSQSSLITVFCEFLFIPAYLFGPYVSWEQVDERTVKAQLIDGDCEVSGLFHFDQEGLFSRFETDDRYYDNGKGKFEKTKFSAIVDSYQLEMT
ncbi:DUF6544 family protein [Alkalihalobacterium sp. APHAB7]|uniref:DUF6544 family protein n=1 Tax=Alkalihalobacterium sp. APHAB7 TaxID=3402081 RepID=UPI003AAB7D87